MDGQLGEGRGEGIAGSWWRNYAVVVACTVPEGRETSSFRDVQGRAGGTLGRDVPQQKLNGLLLDMERVDEITSQP